MSEQIAVWPPFDRFDRAAGGWAGLARYAVTTTLAADDLGVARPAGPGAEADRAVTEALFVRLARMRLRFRAAEWSGGLRGSQLIRHLAWIKSEGGNCADLSLVFAAGLLRAEVAPLLAVTADHKHVFVMTTPGRTLQRAGGTVLELPGAAEHEPEIARGVLELEQVDGLRRQLADGSVVAVNCVDVTDADPSFTASTSCEQFIAPRMLVLDVAYLQAHGFPARDAPGEWYAVQRYPRSRDPAPTPYGAQAALLAQIDASDADRIVVGGPPGQGKSTVAHALIDQVENGAGWFLNAADREALIDSLAQAELLHSGADPGPLERNDREGFAQQALDRLRRSDRPWLVVLDNADGEPQPLLKFLPRPRAGQRVVVTSATAASGATEAAKAGPQAWAAAGLALLELGPVEPAELGQELASLSELIDGRALLLTAFRQLITASEGAVDAAAIAALAPRGDRIDSELRGPTAFRAAIQTCGWWQADVHPWIAGLVAQLPTVAWPVALVAELAGRDAAAVDRLLAAGLLSPVDRPTHSAQEADGGEPGYVTIHRLLARAVVWNLDHAEAAAAVGGGLTTLDDVALTLMTSPAASSIFGMRGDLAAAGELRRRLTALKERSVDDPRLSRALRSLGQVLELRGDTAASLDAYTAMESLLGRGDDDDRLRAEYHHAVARVRYRGTKDDSNRERLLTEGLDHARTAYAIAERLDDQENLGRYLAMQGLLQKSMADFPTGDRTKLELLEAARDVLLAAHELRDARIGEDRFVNPEWARSYFNLAGTYLPLAQADRARAPEYLRNARDVYATVRQIRDAVYHSSVHPHIATCIQGLATVDYYEALLLADTPVERSRLLRDATHRLDEALVQWETIEGPNDGAEVEKAARLMTKIAVARRLHRSIKLKPHPEREGPRSLSASIAPLVTEALEEIGERHIKS